MKAKHYEWDDLVWRDTKADIRTANISLYAGDTLTVHYGWTILGPTRVHLSWNLRDNNTRFRYKRLKRSEFDLDNPLEYPCENCKAERHEPCVDTCTLSAYRVFSVRSATL